jgi:crotonobetainyl-CoA:carnitine CoA-transferase CaiB-like acyl-CoA transferase
VDSKTENGTEALPLLGVRVIDFSRLLPGPWCTQMLGDLGAEVIKIEAPGTGDPSRHNPPLNIGSSVYFNSVNRNKRSIVIDLQQADGREIAHRLIGGADVVVESYSVGVARKLAIDYDTVRALNPRAVYCSVTGFGQDGPLANSPGHDLVIQSIAGIVGVSCIGILAALIRRGADGKGCYIDLAMYDSLLSMANIVMTGALGRASGGTGLPVTQVWGRNPRYTVYPTGDGGSVTVSLLEHRLWARFCEAIDQPHLATNTEQPHDRLSDHGERGALYRTAIAEYCRARGRDEICEHMASLDIPVCPVLTPDEALVSPQAVARGMLEFIDHPVEGRVAQLANPLARAGLANTKLRHAPALGADTDAVLAELGYSADERGRLMKKGVLG